MSVIAKYERRARAINSLLCVGLDSAFERLPAQFLGSDYPQFEFNKHIIKQTSAYASAYKMNIAFYEARGDLGLRELKMTVDFLTEEYPDVLTICDAKRGDIASTNEAYATAIFDWLGFDAVTLQPYLGKDALKPFLRREDKGCIILCRTTNPGSDEFQELSVKRGGKPLWQVVAENVTETWNDNQNCMLVVGANVPEEIREVREIVGEMTLLIPGVGTQGGVVEEVVKVGLNNDGLGLIINASRSIIFADDPSDAAWRLRSEINLET